MFDPYDLFAGFGTDIDVWGVGASTIVLLARRDRHRRRRHRVLFIKRDA